MNDLSTHWQIKKLKDIGICVTGTTPNKNDDSNYGDAIPFIKPPQLFDKTVSDSPEKLSSIGYQKARILPKYSVLVTCIGNLGRTGLNTKPVAFNQQINAIIPNKEIDAKFLFYQAQSNKFKEQLEGLASATTVSIVNKSKFETIEVCYPPLSEQLIIVSKIEELFSELDNGIAQLKTAQQQLKVYRQSLLKAAFEGRLANENVKDGELPSRWKFDSIKNVCKNIKVGIVIKPTAFYSKDKKGIHAFRSANVSEFKVKDSDWVYFSEEANDINKRTQIKSGDVLIVRSGYPGTSCVVPKKYEGANAIDILIATPDTEKIIPEYLCAFNNSPLGKGLFREKSRGVAQKHLNVGEYSKLQLAYPGIDKQNEIVKTLELKMSVYDKLEETINNSLQQAETLRQSILKKAFEGRLVKVEQAKQEAKVIPIYKPQNEYFYQVQLLAFIAKTSKDNGIRHGEMTLAKYAYLTDKIFGTPTYYNFGRWHLGPYPPEIKKAINNKKFFKKENNYIELVEEENLLKYNNPYQEQVELAINELTNIFSKYKAKDRGHETELLATVCKVIEDIQSTDLKAVRKSMADWKIELKGEKYKTKAEKFTEAETKSCLLFIIKKGWDKKLLQQ